MAGVKPRLAQLAPATKTSGKERRRQAGKGGGKGWEPDGQQV